ncbi:uncharacterized protein LOC112467554 [Temnothorax curvispinosus]|uniref:Uncharacterized protein LOC112467554 n=1 Tax=Temnothorax curvispinosus TaxID=300111 RepID=A0A6J1RGR6_9HYME|nr:uncharacterized protein LOC112467554 [Temnothorax curvispinosus]
MGIRAAIKEDIKATPAEMVYGEPIHLPGEFFGTTKNETNETDFIGRLRNLMSRLTPKLKRHGKKDVFIHQDLEKTPYVFVRQDAPTGALHPRYNGPYEVIKRTERFFTIQTGGKPTNVSVERLKPAYTFIENETPSATENGQRTKQATEPTPTAITRNSRTRKPVVRFQAGV